MLNSYYLIIIVLIFAILIVFFLSQKKNMNFSEGYEDMDFPGQNQYFDDDYHDFDDRPFDNNSLDYIPVNDFSPFPSYHYHPHNSIDDRYQELEDSYKFPFQNFPTHAYTLTPFSVVLKDRNKDYSLTSVIRGDVPIIINPDIPLIGKSRYTPTMLPFSIN